jgi:ABC-2 type transport system ATP-binding protein
MNRPLVEVEHLYRYYGDICAVRDLSFQLNKGDILGLLGPNGAGKSTTMQVITGNLAPSAGQVRIAGADLVDHPAAAKAALGYLPEQPPLYRELTVDEYLQYCARLHRIPRREVASALQRAKRRCGLEQSGRRLIGNLSKGYRQRVGIAQAIIHQPAVIILDEPTVGLDPIQIREIRDLIRELGESHGVILSTHILPEVQSVCTRVQIINRGRMVFADDLEGLENRLAGNRLLLSLNHPPPLDRLAALPDVAAVEALEAGRFRLHCVEGSDPAAAIAQRSVESGWGLTELSRERTSLEQVFVDLTLHDDDGEAAR